MPTVFSAAQLAASAAAGDPRNQDSFATTAEWQAYQAEWFKTVTMGEDLPPVGDPTGRSVGSRRASSAARLSSSASVSSSREPNGSGQRVTTDKRRTVTSTTKRGASVRHSCVARRTMR